MSTLRFIVWADLPFESRDYNGRHPLRRRYAASRAACAILDSLKAGVTPSFRAISHNKRVIVGRKIGRTPSAAALSPQESVVTGTADPFSRDQRLLSESARDGGYCEERPASSRPAASTAAAPPGGASVPPPGPAGGAAAASAPALYHA
jgi:hypothetical protein